MAGGLKKIGVLFVAALMLASCSASQTASKKDGAKTLAVKSKAKSKKTKTKTAEVKVKSTKTFKTALAQRPSEINIPVKGKVTRTGEVYLLRGLANVFSRGMDTMGAKMVRSGLDARVYNHAAWRSLADNIVLRSKKKKVSYPIVIIGHSLGANATMMMADYLGKKGVKVSYAVSFDPTKTLTVGKNVSRAINFYLPNDAASNVVKRGSGFRGSIKNINVSGVRELNHLKVDKDVKLQSQVIRRTMSYTKKKRNRKRRR